MMIDHSAFLAGIESYIRKHPEAAAYVQDSVAKGITASLQRTLERAADMEVALAIALARRYKNSDDIILSKLEKWHDRSAVNWTSTIEKLKNA
jgi:hypothetical protein